MSTRVRTFIAIGAAGFVVQIGALLLLTALCGWPYPAATALAVEAAVLHNFLWHERWTWADRHTSHEPVLRRLVRFHLGTGLTSVAGNVVVTALAVECLHLPTLAANAVAVVATSLANFLVADRWVFTRAAVTGLAAIAIAMPASASAAEPDASTIAAWNRHISAVEMTLREHEADPPLMEPEGRSLPLQGGTIYEWRGSVRVRGTTVSELVNALEIPGLPPPAEDILEARVLRRSGDSLHLYMKIARTAVVTVTYDTEHDVTFARRSAGFATSRSVSTRIREEGGWDRGFLWRLNSYWRYRQQGTDVVVDVLSVSLSRDVPSLVRPVVAPLVDRIARESMNRTLNAVDRFGAGLRNCASGCRTDGTGGQ